MLLLAGHCKLPCLQCPASSSRVALCTNTAQTGNDQSVLCRESIFASTVIVLVAGALWSRSRESEVCQAVLSEVLETAASMFCTASKLVLNFISARQLVPAGVGTTAHQFVLVF